MKCSEIVENSPVQTQLATSQYNSGFEMIEGKTDDK